MQGQEHVPTQQSRALVVLRKARGCSQLEIAESMHLSDECLRKHYSIELAVAKAEADDKVYSKLMQRIDAGSDKLIDLYARTQLGWRTADGKDAADATRALAEATAQIKAKAADELTVELRDHLKHDSIAQQESADNVSSS